MSSVCCNVSAKWIRLGCLVVFFAVVVSSLPVHLKYDGANAQSSGRLPTQGPPSRNLPDLDEARGREPGTPKIMPPVPATKCRGRDEKCKKAREKISNNLPDNQDRLLAYADYRSRQEYAGWLKIVIPALSVLDDLIYGSARMISDFPDMSYRSSGDVLTKSAVKLANPRSEAYGGGASRGPRKAYGYRGGLSRSPVAAQSVVTVYPGAYQTPDDRGGEGVSSPSNMGHGSTQSSWTQAGSIGDGTQVKTALWHSFPNVPGTKTRVTLKFDWALNTSMTIDAYDRYNSPAASYDFSVDCSFDNGATWEQQKWLWGLDLFFFIFEPTSRSSSTNPYGSESIDLPPGTIDITQIRVRDRIYARASVTSNANGRASVSATATISNIRIEVERETTPPIISNVSVGGITATGATITWNTNENSDSQVEYKTSTGSWQSTTLNPSLVTFHSQGLSGLTAETLYHYRVKSKDAFGNLAVSGDFSFTTAPPPDTTAPVISSVSPGGITTTGATITWNTNENSDSQVEYKTSTGSWQSTTLNPLHVTAHSQGLSGLTPGTLYHYRVKSRDGAGNLAVSGDFSFTTAAAPPPPTAYSIWPLSMIPTVGMEDPGNSIEIGMKFRSDVNGYITGIKFYKGGPETGSAHIGSLWTSSGMLLGSVTFANETASGWQQASFSTPIPITANTTYVVSYFAPLGNYLGEDDFFASSGVDNGPLHALRDGFDGANGVYRYTAIGGFPTDTYRSENYWVDVLFINAPPTVTSFSPAAGATNVNADANVTVTFSEAMNPATVNGATVELRDPSNALVPATVSYNATSLTATLNPTASLLAGVTYMARVRGGGTDPRVKNAAGNALANDVMWTFGTGWPANLSMALIDSKNRIGLPGKDLLSRNCNWSLPLLGLSGRAGMDLGLMLSLNSLIYTRAGSSIYFDPDQSNLGPGFRLGFPEILNAFTNTDAGVQSYLLSMPSGSRVEFRQISTNVYEAVDSSYMRLTHDPVNSVFILYMTDGAQFRFEDVTGLGDYKCKQIKDRQGNYITIAYGSLAEITTITDTLGRPIDFNYDTFNHLISITQNWGGQTHIWATFAYGTQTIQTNFPGLTLKGTTNGAEESVLLRVGLADGTIYSFEYNTYGQVQTFRKFAPDNPNPINFPGDYVERAYTTYGLPDNAVDPQTDCPRATSRTDGAADWHSDVKHFYEGDNHTWGQVTFPDGTIYKEFFATTGWQRGLTTVTENWAGGVKKKATATGWTQDNTGVSYKLNPRVTDITVSDDAGNLRRTRMSYTNFGLVSDVYEDSADLMTVLRHTHTDYNLSAVYTDRRIIGLPSAVYIKDGNNTLFSKITYKYDQNPNLYLQHQGPPIQHDTPNYGPGFEQGRGNRNWTLRWDVSAPDDESKASKNETGYNTSGSVILTRDPLGHPASVIYDDSFSDGQNRNTYAYPTRMEDADHFSSTVQYNYYFGAVTRVQNPKGAAVTRTHDLAGRIERETNMFNGAYTRYVYASHQREVETFTTINDLSAEFYAKTTFDGHGRMLATLSDHPTSVGGYKAQKYEYDNMGRRARWTNPTESAVNGVPVGDDAEAGWVRTSQAYNWQGLPTVTTNQDGTTKEVLYGGCGCAGGQVVVTRDEFGRRQKMTYDILGRLKTTQVLFIQPKNEPLNGNGAVYSTTTNTCNVRDQVTNVNVKDDASGVSQNTQMVYDGHGRIWKLRRPIETGDTEFLYNSDDTLQRSIDPRGVNAIYSYNNRKLVTGIDYDERLNSPSPPLPPYLPSSDVTFDYDELGNRRWMDDGPGRTDYNFDSLGQLISETRQISAINRSYAISYEYNLIGQLKKITDPWGASITYDRDKSGGVIGATGVGYANINQSTNQAVSQFATEVKYRAWGAVKGLLNGNGSFQSTIAFDYDQRLRLIRFNGGGRVTTHQYYDDGRIQGVQDQHINNFNRGYSYDHAGRLVAASAGTDANPNLNPYSYTYQYDVWGNTTQRSGHYWSTTLPNITNTYVNNRNSVMTYDQAGNITDPGAPTSSSVHWIYDSAGRLSLSTMARTGLTPEERESYEYDGDGRRVGYTSYRINFFPTPAKYDDHYQFFIRSSVLAGEVLAEIEGGTSLDTFNDPMQYLSKSYVYLNGERLAYQNDMHLSPAEALARTVVGKEVRWIYREPVIRTESQSSLYNSNNEVLVDPTGQKIETFDPATLPPPPPPIEIEVFLDLQYYGESPLRDWNSGCIVNGQPETCDRAMGQLSSEGFQLDSDIFQHILTPPTFPRSPQRSLRSLADALFNALRPRGIVDVDFTTPGFGGGFGFLPAQQQEAAQPQQRSDCGRFIDNLVGRVEGIRRSPNQSYLSRTYNLGLRLMADGNSRTKQLGTQPFGGFRRELTDEQNDGVYQHVLGHAGATMIGDRTLPVPIKGGFTGGRRAFTGTELTTYALEYDEHQRDDPNMQHRRRESETEIRDDHAGRLVGGQLMRGVSGEVNSEQLRQVLFGILCDR